MIEALKTFDLVVGTRYFTKGASVPGFSTFRILGSIFCNLLAWPLTGLKDSTSGFFGFRKSVAPNLFNSIDPKSFKIGLEYFYRMKNAKEVPISFESRYKGKTKMTVIQLRYFVKQLISAYSTKFDIKRFLQFGTVGITGIIVNLVILTAAVELKDIQYNLAGVISFISAVVWNYGWNKLWVFRDSQINWLSGLYKFLVVALLALGIKQFVMTSFVEVWQFNYILAAILGIGAASIINFYGNKIWTFKNKDSEGSVSFASDNI
jgi:dolichol-phosphate mannosyltransferase